MTRWPVALRYGLAASARHCSLRIGTIVIRDQAGGPGRLDAHVFPLGRRRRLCPGGMDQRARGCIDSKVEDESQCCVDVPYFVEGEAARAVTKPGGVDRDRLLGQDARRSSADLNLGSETRRTCRGGSRSNQPGRERELIGLDDYGVPQAPLLVPRASRGARSRQTSPRTQGFHVP